MQNTVLNLCSFLSCRQSYRMIVLSEAILATSVSEQIALLRAGQWSGPRLRHSAKGRKYIISFQHLIEINCYLYNFRSAFFPSIIGNHVFIEEDCVINSQQIGSYVHIGKNCVIVCFKHMYLWLKLQLYLSLQGKRAVLRDCCMIADNTVIPPETVVPPFCVYSGSPGQYC